MTWIDPRIWLLVVAGVIAGSACGYFKGHRDADQSAKVADQAKQIDGLRAERDEYSRQLAAQQGIATDAAKERDQARADAAVADGVADGLRKQVAALVADTRRAGAAAGSPATGDALDLLADLFGRADERAGDLAKIADERGIAGQQCERSYDALISDPQSNLSQ
ncbi:DUF2514 domain-containing protein [Burkholderia multivorans]|uniref:DUF2514 family protein n=1 Tax=Burkholderia multivorans TaxID=87883 RepID=UPI000277D961|nr:DUF2514 family protein [Burkholderia multivorans]AJY19158.1 hypothetical protein NP80_2163 [Burkholderia multivorans ATCC BAA-247]AVR22502.1 DUF2514 domain-containing protein [Burkholderia multivorans]EJO63373.1 PF10721 family protein [Burkholderia multivorans ATCC BAA-247]MBU9494168.1 DUF2514 domain-containing protein [Burkholderia multivorans]MCO1435941.1 DUF2514 domain-containing protein [Burkholderia multivorans]